MAVEISFTVPAYNAGPFIAEAVKSIVRQRMPSYEIVIVNDSSTDDTAEVCRELIAQYPKVRFRYAENETNLGGGATRNRCVARAEGEYIFNLDADDILPPNTLPRIYDAVTEYYREHGEYVIGAVERGQFFMDRPVRLGKFTLPFKRRVMLHTWLYERTDYEYVLTHAITTIAVANALFHRSIFEVTGGYFEDNMLDAWGFGVRCTVAGYRYLIVPGTYYLHRISPDSYYQRSHRTGEIRRSRYIVLSHFKDVYAPETLEVLHPDNPDYPEEPFDWIKLRDGGR